MLLLVKKDRDESRFDFHLYTKDNILIGCGVSNSTITENNLFFGDYYFFDQSFTDQLRGNEGFFFILKEDACYACPVNVHFPSGKKFVEAEEFETFLKTRLEDQKWRNNQENKS